MKSISIAVLALVGIASAANVFFDTPLSLPDRTVAGFSSVQVQPSLDTGNWTVRAVPLFSPPLARVAGDVRVDAQVQVTVLVKAVELDAVAVTATNAAQAQASLREAATGIALYKVQQALLAPPAQTNLLARPPAVKLLNPPVLKR